MSYRAVAAAVAAAGLALVLAAGTAADLNADLAGAELVYSYVVFRHGDRTPEEFESSAYPNGPSSEFYPYDRGQLTNIGKGRAYGVGQYLRARFDGLLDRVYLPSQIAINSTNLDRTKMTGMAALAALYPPTALQRWSAQLPWQPIPYSVQNVPSDACSGFYNSLAAEVMETPETLASLSEYSDLYDILSEYSGVDITSPYYVLMLQGAVQGNNNYASDARGVSRYAFDTPSWYEDLLPLITEVVNLEFQLMYYTDELIRSYSGPLLNTFLETAASVAAGAEPSPRVNVLSAHDTTVAGVLAAAGVFTPHRPDYGATFSLELWRNRTDGAYYVATVYKVGGEAGERPDAAKALRVAGCGERALCPLDTFVELTKSVVLAPSDVDAFCGSA